MSLRRDLDHHQEEATARVRILPFRSLDVNQHRRPPSQSKRAYRPTSSSSPASYQRQFDPSPITFSQSHSLTKPEVDPEEPTIPLTPSGNRSVTRSSSSMTTTSLSGMPQQQHLASEHVGFEVS
ncbi:hypothetical protein IAR50_003125 [Cryptococcus sp. DSM 104548]